MRGVVEGPFFQRELCSWKIRKSKTWWNGREVLVQARVGISVLGTHTEEVRVSEATLPATR